MEANAKIALWEHNVIALAVDPHTYETVMAAKTGGRVRLELEVVSGRLAVGLTPRSDGANTLVPKSKPEVSLPYHVRVEASRFSEDVVAMLTRFGMLSFELSGSRIGLSGDIDLVPHLRPWPKLVRCKAYDVGERSVEVYKERIQSCAAAGDVWLTPPREFIEKCPKSFMTIWGEMPTGLELRMEDGRVHRR